VKGLFLEKTEHWRVLRITSFYETYAHPPVLGLSAALAQAGSGCAGRIVATWPLPRSPRRGFQRAQFTLKNGMQLIVQPDRRAPTAVHMVWVRVGSMDEVDGTTGVAHVLEHMMFKGSKAWRRASSRAAWRRWAGRKTLSPAVTTPGTTSRFRRTAGRRDGWRPTALPTTSGRTPSSRRKSRSSRKSAACAPKTSRALLMEQLMATFQSSPYRRPVVGWMSDLDAMTPDDVRQFHRAGMCRPMPPWWCRGRDPDQVRPGRKYLRQHSRARRAHAQAAHRAAQIGVRRIEVKQPAEQAFVAMAYRAPALNLDQPRPKTATRWRCWCCPPCWTATTAPPGARPGQGAAAWPTAPAARPR
jgi:zinc protease